MEYLLGVAALWLVSRQGTAAPSWADVVVPPKKPVSFTRDEPLMGAAFCQQNPNVCVDRAPTIPG